jgi:glycosyltransferase involved in cell wall biosynthesis
MNITLVQAIVLFWLGLLLWILVEYIVYRFQNALQNSEKKQRTQRRVFWFTDTINDLNGVSVTLKNIGWLSHRRGDDLYILGSLVDDKIDDSLPPNYINLKPMINLRLPYYKTLDLNFPSFFKILYIMYKYQPDDVIISTPSAVGALALFASKFFGKKITGIYHTDFAMQAKNIAGEGAFIVHFLEFGSKLFYSLVDRMLVPTTEYINILRKRGLKHKNTGIFKRGIDTNKFHPIPSARREFHLKYGIKKGVNLLFSGRISVDKNIEFLIQAYKDVIEQLSGAIQVNLIFAGTGPDFDRFKTKYNEESIHFLGYIENQDLPQIYSSADLLVFPSETDTFGMAVLEAQSCGVPALVSHIGGPRNIIVDGNTGYVLPTDSIENWSSKLLELIPQIDKYDVVYRNLCLDSREHVLKNFDLYRILDNYISPASQNSRLIQSKNSSEELRDVV